jgi:hypothetical protein
VVVGSINVADQIDPYTLTVADNDVVTIRASRTSGSYFVPQMELYDASGTLIVSAANAITRTFTAGGTYTVLLRDAGSIYTGGYAITWQSLLNPCNTTRLSCGQAVSGTIGTTGSSPPWTFYTFTGTAGNVVTVNVNRTSGSFSPYIELYGPDGGLLGTATGSTSAQLLNKTLTATGTHTVVVSDSSNVNTGNYTVSWQKQSGCP